MSAEFDKQMEEAFYAYLEQFLPQQDGEDDAAFEHRTKGAQGGFRFDMYARDPQDYTYLAEHAPAVKVTSAGGSFPFQAEGYIGGYPFYLRSEPVFGEAADHSDDKAYAKLSVAREKEDIYLHSDWVVEEELEVGHHNLETALLQLVDKLPTTEVNWYQEARTGS